MSAELLFWFPLLLGALLLGLLCLVVRIAKRMADRSIRRNEYRAVRRYQGPVRAVVFDWAGTIVDCGVFAPTATFVRIFADEGVDITEAEARGPMGIHKRAHIEKILESADVQARWRKAKGAAHTAADVDRMYAAFTPLQIEAVKAHSRPIGGAADVFKALRARGIKIGSCTGYPRAVLDVCAQIAKEHSLAPDCLVAADEVPDSRPQPHMLWLNCIRLNAHPIEAVIKVDDTVDGVREGLGAGCWSVGVVHTGNYVALSEAQLAAPDTVPDYERRVQRAYDIMADSGAHYVVDTLNDLPRVIDDIERRLLRGDKP